MKPPSLTAVLSQPLGYIHIHGKERLTGKLSWQCSCDTPVHGSRDVFAVLTASNLGHRSRQGNESSRCRE